MQRFGCACFDDAAGTCQQPGTPAPVKPPPITVAPTNVSATVKETDPCNTVIKMTAVAFSPAQDTSQGNLANLVDSQIDSRVPGVLGVATTDTSSSPSITLTLDAAYENITGQ